MVLKSSLMYTYDEVYETIKTAIEAECEAIKRKPLRERKASLKIIISNLNPSLVQPNHINMIKNKILTYGWETVEITEIEDRNRKYIHIFMV